MFIWKIHGFLIENMLEIFQSIVELHNNSETVCKGTLDTPLSVNITISNSTRKRKLRKLMREEEGN